MLPHPTEHRVRPPTSSARTRWQWISLGTLLAATAVLYLWGLGGNGWANQFYSAAAQAGSQSWKAALFGSSDAANAITVDKTPGALWVMDLSVRLFGLNSWSLLVPQALEGVAAVAVLYASVRRISGHWAGVVAGLVLALTPVATLMFRFNNPDALLVLLLTVAAYCVLRAIEKDASAWWLPLAGTAIGFGFLAKMMQVLLVVPVFGIVYLLAAQQMWRTRLMRSIFGSLAMIASAGWYLLLVALWPADSRPYIGGSQHNSVLELAIGYNGLGRITGNETGGLGNMDFDAGWNRLFADQMGGQIAWLLPAALIAAFSGLWLTRKTTRTDPVRASLLLWTGWLILTGVVFSYSAGIVHSYYTVALAPAIAACFSIGASELWRRRNDIRARLVLATMVVVTAALAWMLLRRTPEWLPWLAPSVIVLAACAAVGLLIADKLSRPAAIAALAVALGSGLAAPAAYSVVTVSSAHVGFLPSAGPPGAGMPKFPSPHEPVPDQFSPTVKGPGGQFPDRGPGGLFGPTTPGSDLVAALQNNAGTYRWAAATIGSNNAAGYQLATRDPVMALGGYNGTDPAPSLEEFETYVSHHEIHYYIDSGAMGGWASGPQTGSRASAEIADWVKDTFTAQTVDGVTLYDLSNGPGA